MATKKTVTRVESDAKAPAARDWKPTPGAKGKATRNRVLAFIFWILAIAAEAFVIFWLLNRTFMNLFLLWIIIALVVIAGLAIAGNLLWKQANKYDPASNANKIKFFINNQLGVIMTMIAFIPLIVMIFMNKDMDGKTKGIAGAVAIVLFVISGFLGIDFEQPSQEMYANESNRILELTGEDKVYWTKSGTKYHIYNDCPSINKDQTTEIFEGTVGTALAEIKSLNVDDPLCYYCENEFIEQHADDPDLVASMKEFGSGTSVTPDEAEVQALEEATGSTTAPAADTTAP